MANRRSQKRKIRKSSQKSRSKAGMIAILIVVLAIGVVFASKMVDAQKRVDSLEKAEAGKQELLDAEYARTAGLEEQQIYVKTKKYIEEKARELGLVYPDEIIFVPEK